MFEIIKKKKQKKNQENINICRACCFSDFTHLNMAAAAAAATRRFF